MQNTWQLPPWNPLPDTIEQIMLPSATPQRHTGEKYGPYIYGIYRPGSASSVPECCHSRRWGNYTRDKQSADALPKGREACGKYTRSENCQISAQKQRNRQ